MRRAPHVGSASRDPTGAGIHDNRSDGRIDHDVRVLRQAVAADNRSAAAAGQVAGYTLVGIARETHASHVTLAVGLPRARATTDSRHDMRSRVGYRTYGREAWRKRRVSQCTIALFVLLRRGGRRETAPGRNGNRPTAGHVRRQFSAVVSGKSSATVV